MAFITEKIVVNVIIKIIHKFLAKLHITCLTYRLELAISRTDVVVEYYTRRSVMANTKRPGETRG